MEVKSWDMRAALRKAPNEVIRDIYEKMTIEERESLRGDDALFIMFQNTDWGREFLAGVETGTESPADLLARIQAAHAKNPNEVYYP